MSADLVYTRATELVRRYRAKQLSPVEVTQTVLARIRELNPTLNAYCLVDEEGALAAARASEARWMKKRAAGRARRRAGLDQGPDPDPRLAYAARLKDGRSRRTVARRRPGDGALARERRGAAGQDLHARIRLERRDRQRAHRHHAQSLEHRAHARRLQRRRLGASRRRHGSAGGGHRRRRLDPHSLLLCRHFRHQGRLRPRAGLAAFALRHGGARRSDGAHGRRLRADAERLVAARCARLDRLALCRHRLDRRDWMRA